MYCEKYKPAWLYKVFKTQAFSDGRFMFRILNGMLSAGISFHKTSLILSKDYFKEGLRPFFAELADIINRNNEKFTINYKPIENGELTNLCYLSRFQNQPFINFTL